jgi:DNA-binding CsgD family transcriptional regulator
MLCECCTKPIENAPADLRGRLAADMEPGVIFTAADGRVIDTNEAADRIFALGDGLSIHAGKLTARRAFETARIAELITSAVGCLLVARAGGLPSYVVRVSQVSSSPPVAMILVSAPDEARVPDRELAELFGLSPAESRVAIGVALGRRLTEIAAEHGVGMPTIRTHISAVLLKCGVARQAELALLISRIPIVHLKPADIEARLQAVCARDSCGGM